MWAALAAAALLGTALTTPGPEHFETSYGFLRSLLLLSRWSHGVWSQYPLVPWFGIAALGVLLGRWIAADKSRAYRALPWLGAGALVAAIAMRAAGGFGNLRAPRDGSWIEFLNLIKYPPSLVFTLFMVGGNLLALAAIERVRLWTTGLGRVLEVFGQAPLAFYIAHLWLFAVDRHHRLQAGHQLRRRLRHLAGGTRAAVRVHARIRALRQREARESSWRYF